MPDQNPNRVFQEVFDALWPNPGVILFTALQWIPETCSLKRVFTSHPESYPLGAEKTVEISAGWLNAVITQKEPFLAADLSSLKEVFTDSYLIQSLGCGAVINIPVLDREEIVGVLALLDAEGQYTPPSVAAAVAVADEYSGALAEAFAAYPAETPRKDAVLQ
jgi:GAF domain-containing protein